eukprot:SAG31_NODE_39466_length_288_cov_0.613757_1_plen_29_part_01
MLVGLGDPKVAESRELNATAVLEKAACVD